MSSVHLKFFQGANIEGGDFRSVSGNLYQQQYISVGSGIQALSQAISHGAMHDAAERDPPPRCHPGTREKATEDIVRWIEEPSPSSTVLWVNGRAGVGKTALMQKIAERGGVYFGGCFFFRRGVSGCNQKGFLFSTLAYQLAMNVVGMLELIDGAMSRDFSLPTKSAAIQLQRLIVEPTRLIPSLPHPFIIIIDGLDECEGLDSQCDILSLVSQLSMDPSIPIRFVIASRPEHQICSAFNKEPLFSMTRRIVLDDEFDSASDIERYLRDKFAEIHTRNKDIMRQIGSRWPSEYDLRTLVNRASGQFIYASTVIKFVGSVTDFLTPPEKLKIILNPGPMQASAFSELDRLYTQILSTYNDHKVLVHILGVVLALENLDMYIGDKPLINLEVIDEIAGVGEGKAYLVIRALQSLTQIQIKSLCDWHNERPNDMIYQRVQLSHRSFHDFLTDEARSGLYFINTDLFFVRIFYRMFELATVSIEQYKSSGSMPKTCLLTWHLFESLVSPSYWAGALYLGTSGIEKTELCFHINNLRATLFDGQLHFTSSQSFEFLSAVIPVLHWVCSALYFIRNVMPFGLPQTHDPLQLSKFYFDTCNILDECYRQVLAGSTVGPVPIPMHIALDFYGPRTLTSISMNYNISLANPQLVKSFLREHSFLFHLTILPVNSSPKKAVPLWSAPFQLRNFFFDPGRSRHLYSVPCIIGNCWEAVKYSLQVPMPSTYNSVEFSLRLRNFFIPNQDCQISGASLMLSAESIRNGPDNDTLLRFLGSLCRIPWDTCFSSYESYVCTLAIARWVCKTLESLSLQSGNIRNALHKVFIEIVPRGILPAFRADNFSLKKTGMLEAKGGSQCLECSSQRFPKFDLMKFREYEFDGVIEVLSACTAQDFFGLFCTTVVEAFLFTKVYRVIQMRKLRGSHSYTCTNRTSPNNEVKPFPQISDQFYIDEPLRRNWGFAFSYASRSSDSILGALQWLCRYFEHIEEDDMDVDWIVGEMLDWLKSQTADPQPQDEVITWMEGAYAEVERALARQKGREMQRSAERASGVSGGSLP